MHLNADLEALKKDSVNEVYIKIQKVEIEWFLANSKRKRERTAGENFEDTKTLQTNDFPRFSIKSECDLNSSQSFSVIKIECQINFFEPRHSLWGRISQPFRLWRGLCSRYKHNKKLYEKKFNNFFQT